MADNKNQTNPNQNPSPNPGPGYIMNNPGEGWGRKIANWFKDNFSIIVAVAIIIVLAASIFAYTKKASKFSKEEDSQPAPELTPIEPEEQTIKVNNENTETNQNKVKDIAVEVKTEPNPKAVEVKPLPASTKTEAFISETAAPGEGLTHLARRALKEYLVLNPDSDLTKEHKVYIEDFLAKKLAKSGKGTLALGESREFSKTLLAEAIAKAQSLGPNQLKNLEQYSRLVPLL